jgi:tetratricopeptide (TPR) repeat protein
MSEQGEWILISLDEKLARRQGMPKTIPVPKDEFEGLADKGLSIDAARRWTGAFLSQRRGTPAPEHAQMYSKLESFLAKGDLWAKAQAAFAAKDFKRAASTLRMISNVDADDHAAKMNLASALASSSDHAGAIKALDAIVETFGDDADFHLTRAHVLLALERNSDAAESFARALEIDGGNRAALEALVKLGVLVKLYEDARDAQSLTYVRVNAVVPALEEAWATAARTPSFFIDQAAYHSMEGRHEAALAAATLGLAMTPEGPDEEKLAMAKVAALRALGRGEEAVAAAREYRKKAPKSVWACTELARTLASGSSEEAKALVDEALALDPGDAMALSLKFLPPSLDDVAAVGAALPALREFAGEHAGVAGAQRVLGRMHVAAGRVDEGLEDLRRAVTLAPADDEIRAELWAELARQRKFQDLLDDAATVTDLAKRDWKLRWGEAEAWAGLGKGVESKAAFGAINHDESLPVDVRKHAKRAAESIRQ